MIQQEIKALVKSLFNARAAKSTAASGQPPLKLFTEEGLDLLPGSKYKLRYDALEAACLLELSSIIAGVEHEGFLFTEMQYMNNDAAGMTLIVKCLTRVRAVLCGMPEGPLTMGLKTPAAQTHGVELLNIGHDSDSDAEEPGEEMFPRCTMLAPRESESKPRPTTDP